MIKRNAPACTAIGLKSECRRVGSTWVVFKAAVAAVHTSELTGNKQVATSRDQQALKSPRQIQLDAITGHAVAELTGVDGTNAQSVTDAGVDASLDGGTISG